MIQNFQALRALAALLVTFAHIDVFVAASGIAEHYLMFGNSGVDLFFVLSGFVIVHSTAKRVPGAGEFMQNRLIRVAPIYWLFTMGVFAVALAAPKLLNATNGNWSDLARSILFIPYMRENGVIKPVLFVGWTLNYEMFFYALFALALLIAKRNAVRATVLCSIAILFFIAVRELAAPASPVLRFYGYSIVLEFAFGMWIAHAVRRWPDHGARLAWPALVGASAWLLLHGFASVEGPRWLVAGLPSAAIMWAAFSVERRGWKIASPKVQLLGAASYALYLSHAFVLQGIGKAIVKVSGPIQNPAAGLAVALAAIVIAHGIGVAIHLMLEQPMVAWLKANAPRFSLAPVASRFGARDRNAEAAQSS